MHDNSFMAVTVILTNAHFITTEEYKEGVFGELPIPQKKIEKTSRPTNRCVQLGEITIVTLVGVAKHKRII